MKILEFNWTISLGHNEDLKSFIGLFLWGIMKILEFNWTISLGHNEDLRV